MLPQRQRSQLPLVLRKTALDLSLDLDAFPALSRSPCPLDDLGCFTSPGRKHPVAPAPAHLVDAITPPPASPSSESESPLLTPPGEYSSHTGYFGPTPDTHHFHQDIQLPTDMKKQPSTHNLRIPPSSSPPKSHDLSPSESPRTSMSSLSLGRSLSRASSSRTPPPSDLLDDDPFASHSPSSTSNEFFPVPSSSVESSFHKLQSEAARPGRPPLRPSPSVPMLRSNSGFPGGRQLRPAYTRPAFSTRPSLPSLNLLAKSEFAVTVKARKGTVGARLPVEPWDNIDPEPSMNIVPDAPRLEMELPSARSDRSMGNDSTQYSKEPSSPIHVLLPSQDDGSRTSSVFVQSPTSLEVDPSQPNPRHDSGEMFSSLYDVITRLSPTHSRSSSASSFGSISRQSQALPRFGSDLTPRSSLESECSDEEIQTCSPSSPRDGARVLSPGPGPTPYTSEYPMPGGYLDIEEFQPGTSVGTIRPSIHKKTSREGSLSSDEGEEEDWHSVYDDTYFNDYEDAEEAEAFDADGWERGRSSAGGGYRDNHRSARSQSRGRDLSGSNGGGGGDGGRGYSGGGSGNGGRDDEDDRGRDDRNRRRVKASYPANDTEESGTDDEQPPVPPLPHHIADAKHRPTRTATAAAHPQVDSANTDDDDVPLARSIPTALKAQRTIRRQVRDENDERRRQRSLRYKGRQQSAEPDPPMPEPTHASPPRPARDASRSPLPTTRTNIGAQELVAPAPVPRTRPRAKTFTTGNPNPFSADDLAKRLMSSQVNGAPTASSSRHPSVEASSRRPSADDYGPRPAPAADERASQERTLRPMRSFHRGHAPEASGSLPVPPVAPTTPSSYRVGRSNTSAAPSSKRHEDAYAGKPTSLPVRPYTEQAPPQRSRSVRRRPSDDLSRGASRQPSAVPDVPPVPAPAPAQTGPFQVVSREKAAQAAWQQRVFVFDMQRFHMVEIGPGTTARDVVNMLEQQGRLANWAGAGGWMVFEISQDFGMERPLRGFEVVADVVKSWDKDRTVNTLLAKKTPMASVLHHSVIPASSPRCGGYVEWEVKRGSWKKRWLELREQGLWLAKKDTGKDETFLCSVSNFDGYVVTRVHRSPKPFVFAVKSTDNLTFFENASDYVHVFSCGEKDGHNWLEKIMLARSYIINQERNVISNVGQTASVAGANLSRAGTRKGARLGPPQPLLSSGNTAPAPIPDRNNVFEPGSLLSKR